jgi:hypothetical protein
VVVLRDSAERLADAVFTYASTLKDTTEQARKQLPFLRQQGLGKREEDMLAKGELARSAFDLAKAIETDLAATESDRFAIFRSRTLEESGRFGLTLLKTLKLEDNTALRPVLRGALGRLDGFQDILTGLAKTTGKGKLEVDDVTHYLDGTRALLEVSLEARNQLTPGFAYLKVIQDFGIAGYKHARQGHLDVDLITAYFDAANTLAWTAVGVTACAGNAACAGAVQNFGSSAARILRESTYGIAERVMSHFTREHQDALVNDWMTVQRHNIRDGKAVQKISDVYGLDILKRAGLSDDRIRHLDDLAARPLPKPATAGAGVYGSPPPPPPPVAGPDVGGVLLQPGKTTVEPRDLGPLRRSIIDRR